MISFASTGLAAAGAACVAAPVLVHLILRRRRRPREWAAMELLREAIRRVERRRRVERWMLLAVRCALVALAAAAIAGPFVGSSAPSGRRARTLVVVIDDGAASNERVGDGTALSLAVAAARPLVDDLGAGDRVAIVRTTRPSDGTGEPASIDRSGAMRRLDTVSSSEVAGDLASAISAGCAILAHPESVGTERRLFVASAMREGSVRGFAPLASARDDERPIRVSAMDAPEASSDNLRIASVVAGRPAGSGPDASPLVKVVVERDRGDGPVTRTVRVNGATLAAPGERSVTLAPGERAREVTIPVVERADLGRADRSRPRAVVASIDPDAQPVDNVRGAVLASAERVRAVIVDRRSFDGAGIDRLSQGDWIARALAPTDPPDVDATTVDPASFDARSCAAADLVIVAQPQVLDGGQWGALASFVGRGGSCVVLPPARERAHPWTGPFRDALAMGWPAEVESVELDAPARIEPVRRESGALAGIMSELPQLAGAVDASRMVRIGVPASDPSVVLDAPGAGPVLLQWSPPGARGTVLLFTVAMDPSWTTVPLKPLMVPLWQEIAADARRRAGTGFQAMVGSVASVDLPGVVELRPVTGDGQSSAGMRSLAVGAGGRTMGTPERAGIYEMIDGRGESRGSFVVNADAASASVRPADPARSQAWLTAVGELDARPGASEPAAVAARNGPGDAIAAWLLCAGFALAVLECVLARRFSHATAAGTGPVHAAVRVASGRSA